MPSGKNHDRITLWSLPWIAGVSWLITGDGELTLIVSGCFLFSGLMFGPDLDIYSVQFKRWGLLRYIWLPYQKSLPHRSILSHGLIIGTLIRVFYLVIIMSVAAIFIVGVSQLIWGFTWNWQQAVLSIYESMTTIYLWETLALFCGLELGSMSHSFSDWISSAYKRRQRKKPPKRKTYRRK